MAAVYLGQVFDTIRLVLNKERKGSVKDSQIVTSLRIGTLNYFGRQLMEYRAGMEVPSTLRQQKAEGPIVVTLGVGPLPVNFAKEISFVTADPGARPGEFLSVTEFADRTQSQLLPPSMVDPIAKIRGTSIVVSPTGNITLSYIKLPVDFIYVPIVDADGRGTTVDLATSTDIDFPTECLPDIIKEALVVLGIKQQDAEAVQFGASVKE